jgi:large subunit ribosomal protein L52
MSKELDFAIERHDKLKVEKEQTRKKILESKLKPKGHLLLKNKKQK